MSLNRLDLGDNFVEDAAMCELVRGLYSSRNEGDRSEEEGDEDDQPDSLSDDMLKDGLQILDLQNNHFGLTACNQLQRALAAPDSATDAVPKSSLTELNLNGCSVGAAGAAVIGQVLRFNSSLLTLRLGGRRPNGRRAVMTDDRLGAEGLRVSA